MWQWTCAACGETFDGETKDDAEGKFFAHAQQAHNPKVVFSYDSTEETD